MKTSLFSPETVFLHPLKVILLCTLTVLVLCSSLSRKFFQKIIKILKTFNKFSKSRSNSLLKYMGIGACVNKGPLSLYVCADSTKKINFGFSNSHVFETIPYIELGWCIEMNISKENIDYSNGIICEVGVSFDFSVFSLYLMFGFA